MDYPNFLKIHVEFDGKTRILSQGRLDEGIRTLEIEPPRDRGPGDQDDDCLCQPVSAARNR